jgi:hypothetical protein
MTNLTNASDTGSLRLRGIERLAERVDPIIVEGARGRLL